MPRAMKKDRIFVWPENETVLENMVNRRDRPAAVWLATVVPEVLKRFKLTPTAILFSRRAGCACGCSPGFVLKESWTGYNYHATVNAAGSIVRIERRAA